MSKSARAAGQQSKRRRPDRRGPDERLREDLISAAMTLIEAQQGEQLTLRGIARHVGVAPTSVYLHLLAREVPMRQLYSARNERSANSAG